MRNLQITKTDYLNFRFCRKNLWLLKNRPDEFKQMPLSEFELEIVKEGQAVDAEARNLFTNGVLIDGDQDVAVAETKYHMDNRVFDFLFQAAIKVNQYYIRTDVLEWNNEAEAWDLLEVKATTKIKKEKFNNHIYDLAFQYNICKLAGLKINQVGVIFLNKDFIKDGEINYHQLFKIEYVTDEILEIADSVKEEMDLMIDYLNGPEEKYCQCRFRTRSEGNHCTTFNYSNPDVPDYAVHDITRISKKKLNFLVEENILAIEDVPEGFALSDNQSLQVVAAKKNKPIKDMEQIEEFLSEIKYPIYFLDYESYLPAIPWFDGYKPYQNIVFQYSLHVLENEPPEDADLEWLDTNIKHFEFLASKQLDPSTDITESLTNHITNQDGTILVWHKPFEMGRNRELGVLNPIKKDFMNLMNDRIIDLKEIFSKGMYVDPKFLGSASIKKVLPVIAPDLSYKNLAINNGADANKMWGKMVSGEVPAEESDEIYKNLLIYCKQDTFAMVRIWFYLNQLFRK